MAVYYDDMFNDQFGEAAVTRIEAVMAIVDEMYSESETLKTVIDVNTVGIEHAAGSNWGIKGNWIRNLSPWSRAPIPGGDLSQIATNSPHEANLYVFLTGYDSKGRLGLASLGTVCDSTRKRRVNMNKYAAGIKKGGDASTAEVIIYDLLCLIS